MHWNWHGGMSGAAHDDSGTTVVGGRVGVALVVVVVDDVVAPAMVDEVVVVDVVVVVGSGTIASGHSFLQMRAMLFCWPAVSFMSHNGHEAMRFRNLRRQLRSIAFLPARHCVTQPSVILQRPPLVE